MNHIDAFVLAFASSFIGITICKILCMKIERLAKRRNSTGDSREEWTKFNKDDPKTFPPVGGFLGYFANDYGNEFQGVCFREPEDTDDAFATRAIYPGLTHWRPLPPPPGKEGK